MRSPVEADHRLVKLPPVDRREAAALSMTPQDAIATRVVQLDREIARLESEREVLRQAANLLNAATVRLPASAPRTREQILADLVAAAGSSGLSRRQCIQEMSKVCSSPATSISTMLSRLQANHKVRNVNGRWVAVSNPK